MLHGFRFFPGLSVHWLLFGASGRRTRPAGGGMLQHYTQCGGEPRTTVKTIANTYHILGAARHAHNVHYRCATQQTAFVAIVVCAKNKENLSMQGQINVVFVRSRYPFKFYFAKYATSEAVILWINCGTHLLNAVAGATAYR